MILGALVAVVNQGNSAILTVILSACHVLIHRNEQRKEAGTHRDISGDIHPFSEGLPLLYGARGPQSPDWPLGSPHPAFPPFSHCRVHLLVRHFTLLARPSVL